MHKQIYVNLPVKNLQKTKEFFSQIGYSFNPKFSNDKAVCMILGEDKYVMLLTEEFFKTFISKDLVDAHNWTEVLMGVSAENREEVDSIVDKALRAGANETREPQDHGFMYTRTFEDLDGHIWEVIWMDEEGFDAQMAETTET